MQDLDLGKFFKKVFARKNFASIFVASLLALSILLLIVFSLVWYFRADVFRYFAKEYLQETTQQKSDTEDDEQTIQVIAEIIEEKEIIFSEENFVIDAVKKTNPAVVSIIISREIPAYETYIDPNKQTNTSDTLIYRKSGTTTKQIGGGSGFFVSSDGLIVTNRHVVDKSNVEYTVFTNDGKKHVATVVARDPVLDIALIKIEGNNFPSLTLGNSDTLQVGQSVIVIGNALAEFRNTVSVGVISGLARSIVAGNASGGTEILDLVIQTDAAINPGNSGGPLLDLKGRVVGVNVAAAKGSQNIGFALPINSVKGAIESVKSTGKIVRPYLGIRYISINKAMQETNGLDVDYGVLVKSGANQSELAVTPGSPADKAGIVENTIILEIDGVKLDGKTNLASVIRKKKIGQAIDLKILHRGAEKHVFVVLEAAPDAN